MDNLKSELGGKFETLIVGLMTPPIMYDVKSLRDAIKVNAAVGRYKAHEGKQTRQHGARGAASSGVFTSFDPQGAGTDEKVLVEILASRTPGEINAIKATYKKGKTVRKQYLGITNGSFSCSVLIVFSPF